MATYNIGRFFQVNIFYDLTYLGLGYLLQWHWELKFISLEVHAGPLEISLSLDYEH